jgi:predicted nucleic acid-binding protein
VALNLLLDTNRYTDLARGTPDVVALVSSAGAVFLSFITLSGTAHRISQRQPPDGQRKPTQAIFIAAGRECALYADETTVEIFADLNLQLRRSGTPIPDHDIWIAALALQHGLTLYARDKHFDHLPQLARV